MHSVAVAGWARVRAGLVGVSGGGASGRGGVGGWIGRVSVHYDSNIDGIFFC
jgi:hypothetical protein